LEWVIRRFCRQTRPSAKTISTVERHASNRDHCTNPSVNHSLSDSCIGRTLLR
jgi:hypothetical protein